MDPPNILLITVDCLRADHMSCYGYERRTTPHIDEFCKTSTVYRNHMSNGPTTPNSFPAIMCSRYKLEMPGLMLPRKWSTIAEVLSESGYYTAGMSSMNPWTSTYFGYHRGFKIFRDYMENSSLDMIFKRNEWGRITSLVRHVYDIIGDAMERNQIQDMQFARDVLEMSERLRDKEPWFLWAHYMDTHTDYFPKEMHYGEKRLNISLYVNLLNKLVVMDKHIDLNIRKDIIDLYDNAVRQVDKNIKSILTNIDTDNTMVIITSDHGEGFEEHEHWVHQHYSMYEELLRIPMIIHYPYRLELPIVSKPTSSVDILPTIVDVTDSFPPPIMRGTSLLNIYDLNRPVFHEGIHATSLKIDDDALRIRGVTADEKRLIIDPPNMRLFDIKDDPGEVNDLIDDDNYKELRDQLISIINDMKDDEIKTMLVEGGASA